MYMYTYKEKATNLVLKNRTEQSISKHTESYAVMRSVCSMCALA